MDLENKDQTEEVKPSEPKEGEGGEGVTPPEDGQANTDADSDVEETQEFEKKEDLVSANKYNQAIRKQREIESEKKELERQLEKQNSEQKKSKPKAQKEPTAKEKEDSFFDDLEDDLDSETDVKKETKEVEKDAEKLIEEKLEPIRKALVEREKDERKQARTTFFETYPQYLNDAEKWNSLLDELNNSINPASGDDYFTQLEKAHILLSGQAPAEDDAVVDAKKNMARDAASGGGGEESTTKKGEFTAEDRKIMKQFDVSEDGYRAYLKKIKDGSMQVIT